MLIIHTLLMALVAGQNFDEEAFFACTKKENCKQKANDQCYYDCSKTYRPPKRMFELAKTCNVRCIAVNTDQKLQEDCGKMCVITHINGGKRWADTHPKADVQPENGVQVKAEVKDNSTSVGVSLGWTFFWPLMLLY